MRGDYLVRRGKKGTLYFKWPVPKAAQAAVGRAVIWKSLKTTDYEIAEVAAARLWADLQEVVRAKSTMTDPILKNLFFTFKKTDTGEVAFDSHADTPEEKRQVAEALRLLTATPEMQNTPWATSAPEPKLPECDNRKISEVWQDYRKEKLTAGVWTADTDKAMSETLGIFLEIMGDKKIPEYTRTGAMEFPESLTKLPPNRRQRAPWRDMPIQEILRRAPGGQSISNINKHIANIAAFFFWYDRRWPDLWPKQHPFTDLKIKGKSRAAHQKRDLITDDQVSQLMPHVTKAVKDWQFWIIPLGAFTGARVRELAQLLVEDVKEVEGIAVISVIDNEGEEGLGVKRVKTEAARRLIPLHDTLLNMGFMDFVESMAATGEKKLWPDVTQQSGTKGGCGRSWSRYFGGVKKELGLPDTVVFHSFRHSVESKLAALHIDRAYISDIIGHARKGDTGETTYTKTFLPERKKAIDRIKYEGVEWPKWEPGRAIQKKQKTAGKARIASFKSRRPANAANFKSN